MFSYFTIKDANEILPTVIKKFKNILNMKNEVFKIQSEMENNPKYMSSFQDYVIKNKNLIQRYLIFTNPLKIWRRWA